MISGDPRITAVVITHNRRLEVLRTLDKLCSLPERPPIIVVDNASTDGTADEIARYYRGAEVIRTASNLGAAARNLGVERAATPYVALCDDDTWWEPGSLSRAADILDDFPRVAILTARLLNGPEEVEDPICRVLADSPIEFPGPLPGKPLLGFLAGASVVRRDAFLEVGGFEPRLFIGGEEQLLAIDLAARGWALCYVPELVGHHYPSPRRDTPRRNFAILRNRLWVAWLRRPLTHALAETWTAVKQVSSDWLAAKSIVGALAGLPWVVSARQPVPPELERQLVLLDAYSPDRQPAITDSSGQVPTIPAELSAALLTGEMSPSPQAAVAATAR
jgi:GT2 family glycosyltransferase